MWNCRNYWRFEGSRSSELILRRNVEEAMANVSNNSHIPAKVCTVDIALLAGWGVKVNLKLPKLIVTTWIKQGGYRFKFNSDGCSRGNPGLDLVEGGALLRSSEGNVVWAIADYYGVQTG